MSAQLREWENIISRSINGAPLPTMLDEVRAACIEFCTYTRVVTEFVDDVDWNGSRRYVQVPDSGEDMIPSQILWAQCAHENEICAATESELQAEYGTNWAMATTDTVSRVGHWFSDRPTRIRLIPHLTIDYAGLLALRVAYKPKQNAIKVPQFLYEQYAEAIGYGALSKLHAHHGAEYADRMLVAPYRAEFQKAMMAASPRKGAGFGRRPFRSASDRGRIG